MPTQHTQAEAPLPLFIAPPTAETLSPAAALTVDTPRYDAATVQQILVSAQEMQARHRETLTEGDIHALGQEIGVEPEFVARALAQADRQNTAEMVSVRPRAAARRSRITDWLPLILYMLSGPLVVKGLQILAPPTGHDTHHRQSTASSSPYTLAFALYAGFFLVLPGILAFCGGFRQKSKMRGAGAGAWYGLASLLAVGGSVLYGAATEVHEQGWSGTTVSGAAWWVGVTFLLLLGTWLGYGALLGMGGASVRQIVSRRRKQRVRGGIRRRGKVGEWV